MNIFREWVSGLNPSRRNFLKAGALTSAALAAGATSVSELTDQFYGDRHGAVEDSNGNHWYIATHKEDVSSEELQKRTEEMMKGG